MPGALEPDVVFAKDYRVLRPLDEGGMGVVYVVEQVSTGEQRALKVMQSHLVSDAKTRDRFLQEAKVRARIKSEHVVKVIAAGVDEATGSPYIAMELLDGETLESMVERRERLGAQEVCTVFEHLGHALSAAHNAGVVHRDIKPENIFVASSQRADVPFTVKLLDFGIAKVVKESADGATTGALIGSPLWMAPEQCNAGRIRATTDVWALGLLAFWCMTGRYYWKSAHNDRVTIESLLVDILLTPFDPPTARAAHYGVDAAFPPGFDEWFSRCLTRDPDGRYANAAEAVKALLLVLSDGKTRVTFPSLVSPAPQSSPEIHPIRPSSPGSPTPLDGPVHPTNRGGFKRGERDASHDDVELSPTLPRPSASSVVPTQRGSGHARVAVPAFVTAGLVAVAAFTVIGPSRTVPLGISSSNLPPPVPAVTDVPVVNRPDEPPPPIADASPAVAAPRADAGRSPRAPSAAVVRPAAPPRAAGHSFSRRLDWDSNCASNPRRRRAWAVSPYFASHAESETAARSANCVDIVGGIGWCCP